MQINPPNIYTSAGDTNLLPGWNINLVTSDDAMMAIGQIPPASVITGRGGSGQPACAWVGRGEGISFYSPDFNVINSTLLQFWVFSGNESTYPISLALGNQTYPERICPYLDVREIDPVTEYLGWISYSIFVPNLQSPKEFLQSPKVFVGCDETPPSQINTAYLLNNQESSMWLCIDDVLWR